MKYLLKDRIALLTDMVKSLNDYATGPKNRFFTGVYLQGHNTGISSPPKLL